MEIKNGWVLFALKCSFQAQWTLWEGINPLLCLSDPATDEFYTLCPFMEMLLCFIRNVCTGPIKANGRMSPFELV